jgi:hypothetical protein
MHEEYDPTMAGCGELKGTALPPSQMTNSACHVSAEMQAHQCPSGVVYKVGGEGTDTQPFHIMGLRSMVRRPAPGGDLPGG